MPIPLLDAPARTAGVAFSPLLVVRNDVVRERIVKTGRFALERAAALSPRHREQAIDRAIPELIRQMEREGMEYAGVIKEPETGLAKHEVLPHVPISEDFTPDPGLVPPPPFPYRNGEATVEQLRNYAAECAVYEKAERDRSAWDAVDVRDMVDVRVFVAFIAKRLPSYRTAPGGHRRA